MRPHGLAFCTWLAASAARAASCPAPPASIDPAATVLGRLAAGLEPGRWAELAAAGLDRDLLYIDANGADGSTAHTDWCDELHWDIPSQTVLFIGAGHLRSFGFVQYQAAPNRWCREDAGLPPCMYETGYSGCFTHAYDHQAYDPLRRKLYIGIGQWLGEYDVASRAWTERSLPSGTPLSYGAIIEHFPPTDELFIFIGGDGVFNTVGGANRPATSGLATGPYHNAGTYTAAHRQLIFGGGNGSSALFSLRADGTVEAVPDAPTVVHTAYSTLTTDPITGDVLLLSEAGTFHAYEPGPPDLPGVWRDLPAPPFTAHALATPIPDHGVVLFMIPQGGYQTYLYKHAPRLPDDVPPAAPTNLAVR